MLVSRNALQSYTDLKGTSNTNYFANRQDRNTFYNNAVEGQYVAINCNNMPPESVDWSDAVWEVERFNGINWVALTLDNNFALIVTNDGLAALADASSGEYKLSISRMAVKQTPIAYGENLATWTENEWINSSGYADVCLDTYNAANSTFTIENNLAHRTNLLNGGIQFTLTIKMETLGQAASTKSQQAAANLTQYDVAAIALYVRDMRTTTTNDILFAIANLPAAITKFTTTPSQTGNELKFYLNLTLSNMGTVTNVELIPSSVNSVPEVVTEAELESSPLLNRPYNLYLVDNFASTNIPAIGVRKGNPTSSQDPVVWTYFTPTDDKLQIDPQLVDSSLKDYMIAAWNPTTEKYVPADGKLTLPSEQLSGLHIGNYIIYAGKIVNSATDYTYRCLLDNEYAQNYGIGDIVQCTVNAVTFSVKILNVGAGGKPIEYYVSPTDGNTLVSTGSAYVALNYPAGSVGFGTGLTMRIISDPNVVDYVWNFPLSWINRPLYVDYDHTSETQQEWTAYCTAIGLDPTTEARNRKGKLTIAQTESFVGWCNTYNSIVLALDLRNEATEVTYGTTRYATSAEVQNPHANPIAAVTTSVTPGTLKAHYVQFDAQAGNAGESAANPIVIDSHLKFNTQIVSTVNGVGFQGTSYRAEWGDLAEYYKADKLYPAGTLVCIGCGLEEITEAKTECNGIISTKPGYELGNKTNAFDLPVALVGKIPVLFANDCVPKFGDRVYLSKNIPGRASIIPNGMCLGKVIDKREHLDQVNNVMCSIRISF